MPYTRQTPTPPNQTQTPIRADLYPARITHPDGTTQEPIKAIIGLDTLWIYNIAGNTGNHIATYPLDDIRGSTQHGYTITTNGQTILINRSGHCGCGNNKSWKPFPYRITMTPIPR